MIRLLRSAAVVFYRLIRPLGVLDVTRLLHLPVGDSLRHQPCPDGYEIRCVQRAELELLLKEERISTQVGKAAVLGDHRRALVAAYCDGRVVSFTWLATQTVQGNENFSRAVHLGTSIDMPDGMAFVFNAWTDVDHRGNRLVAALLTWATCNRVCGAWSLLTMVDWSNERSLRAFEHMGIRDLGQVYRLGLGPVQLSLIPKSAQRLGLRIADDAPGLKLAW